MSEEIKDLFNRIKSDVRETINKYATECAKLAPNAADPHTPVVQAVQIALANAAIDYMVLCGDKPVEALQDVVNSTGLAMKQWTDTCVRAMGLTANTTVDKTTIEPANDTKPN